MKQLLAFIALIFVLIGVITVVAFVMVFRELQNMPAEGVETPTEQVNEQDDAEEVPVLPTAFEAFKVFSEETEPLKNIEQVQEGEVIVYKLTRMDDTLRYVVWGEGVFLAPEGVVEIAKGTRAEDGTLIWAPVAVGTILEVTPEPFILR